MKTVLLSVLVFLGVFGGTAAASTGVAETGWLELAEPVYRAILAGQYWAAAAFALVLATAGARRLLAPRVPFFRSDAGGTLLLVLGSFGGALGTAILAAGVTAPSLAMAKAALWIAFAAGGGYTAVKRLVLPVALWLEARLPWYLRPLASLLVRALGLVTSPPSPALVAEAVQAGRDAVVISPSAGVDRVTGAPRDVL